MSEGIQIQESREEAITKERRVQIPFDVRSARVENAIHKIMRKK